MVLLYYCFCTCFCCAKNLIILNFSIPVPRPPKIDASAVKEIFVKKGENIEVNIPFDGK